ncbi:TetR/AcrR family transcriptional regulator [Inquilinus sp. YAF38]|uniref:TetR/AcrR family transcriptional regulator n=1 Tax=Inquilinus sp. YAF38 TaxID=3233084 RepID=UPI003F8D9670
MTTAKSGDRRAPGRPRSRAAEEAILKAALALFLDHGVEGASIERIAKRAGVGKTTIYRRWSSKEELLAQAIGRVREDAERDMGVTDFRDFAELPLGPTLHRMMEAGAELMASDDNRKLLARLIGSVQSHPRLLAIYWETYLRPRREAFGVMLDQAKMRGELSASADTAMLQDMMGGAMLHRLLIDPAPPTAEDLRAYLARLLQQLGLTEAKG